MIDKVNSRISRIRKDGRLVELLRGSGLVLSFKILGALGGYAFAILLSKWAGARGLGLFEMVVTAITIISVVARLGLESAIVKYISGFHIKGELGKIRSIYGRSALVVIGVSVLISAVFFVLADKIAGLFSGFHPWILTPAFKWAALFIPVFALLQLNAEALRGMKRMTDFSLLQNGSVMVLSVVILWLLSLTGDPISGITGVDAYVYSLVILLIISFAMLFRAYRKDLNRAKPVNVDFRKVMKTAFPMFVSGSVYLVMSWTDTLMVGGMMTDADVGVYRFAFRMATLITFSQFAINSIAAPMISGFSTTQDTRGLRSIIHQIAWVNLLLSFPVFLVFVLFPEWVLITAAGDSFVGGISSLRILALGQVVNALCGPVMYTLNMTGHERDSQRIMLYTAVLNLVLNLVLIPRMGISGAAVATTVSMIIWNVAAGWKVYKYFSIISLPIPWNRRAK